MWTRFTWVDNVTKAVAARFNNQEEGIEEDRNLAEETAAQLRVTETALESLQRSVEGGLPAPIAVSIVPTTPSPSAATLKGEVNPNGQETEYWFEWGPTSAFGSSSTPASLTAGKALVAVSAAITGSFTAGTLFRLVARSNGGITNGETLTFGNMVPTAIPAAATGVSGTGATLNGTVDANGLSTTVTFEWGATTGYGKTASGGTVTGILLSPVLATISEALSGTIHFRVKAVNSKGTTNSADQTFTVGSVLLAGDATTSYANADLTSTGRVEAFQYSPKESGTIEELEFRTAAASSGITKVILAVYADASGKPGSLLQEHETTAELNKANTWLKVTGFSVAVTVGTPIWLGMLPIGSTMKFNSSVASGGTPAFESASSLGTLTTAAAATLWEADSQGGPVGFQAIGKAATSEPVPTLKVNVTDKQTVEWNHLASETEYQVAVSNLPSGTSGRKTGYVLQAKTTDPQHFKPEPGVTYFNSEGSFTPAGLATVYVGARIVGGTWAAEVAVTLPEAPAPPASAVMPGIHLNWKNGAEPFTLAKNAAFELLRPGLGGYSLSEALKYAAANGQKVGFILKASSGTFNLKPLIEEWEKLSTAEKTALAYVELGNENWGNESQFGFGAGEKIPGKKMAEEFIKAAGVQEAVKWPIPIVLQARVVPGHGATYMEEQMTASKAELKKALEPKAWLPAGNYFSEHCYFGLLTSEQESATSLTNCKDKAGLGKQSEWGGQRWLKAQWFYWKELGLVVPCVITEYGAQDTTSGANPVETAARVATTIKAAFEHCRKLEKGEYPTQRPEAGSWTPKLVALVWYDQNSWQGTGQERYGIYFENNKKRTEAGIWEAAKAGAESI